MFSEQYDQYILLQRDQANGWRIDKRTVLLVGCLVLPVSIFCGTYMVLFGIYEKLTYPKTSLNTFNSKGVLEIDQYRAVAYSRHNMLENLTEVPNRGQLTSLHSTTAETLKLVCYYNFPTDQLSMKISDIDPTLCTHLNVAFASVENGSVYLDETNLEYLKEIVALKEVNKDLKIMLSIGGYNNGEGYPQMVKNHANRKIFIQSVLNYVKEYKIDGIDLDWEFPGEHTMYDRNQKMHFTQLLSEIRKEILRQEKHKFLLTVAVAAPTEIVDLAYDVSYMNNYVDFINLMSYDYHYYTMATPFTGINSPLYAKSSEAYYLATLNINFSTNYWNQLGMDKTKIVVGLPAYGHSYRLININNNKLYAPAAGYGKLGNLGFASYPMICNFLQTNHINPIFDMENFSPYASKYFEWVSFDDQQSLTYKTEFVKNNNFGGVMFYSLNADDFQATCNLGVITPIKFPLLNAIKNVLDGTN